MPKYEIYLVWDFDLTAIYYLTTILLKLNKNGKRREYFLSLQICPYCSGLLIGCPRNPKFFITLTHLGLDFLLF